MKRFIAFLLAIVSSVVFVSCSLTYSSNESSASSESALKESSTSSESASTISVKLPVFDKPISVLSAAAEKYFETDINTVLQDAVFGQVL